MQKDHQSQNSNNHAAAAQRGNNKAGGKQARNNKNNKYNNMFSRRSANNARPNAAAGTTSTSSSSSSSSLSSYLVDESYHVVNQEQLDILIELDHCLRLLLLRGTSPPHQHTDLTQLIYYIITHPATNASSHVRRILPFF